MNGSLGVKHSIPSVKRPRFTGYETSQNRQVIFLAGEWFLTSEEAICWQILINVTDKCDYMELHGRIICNDKSFDGLWFMVRICYV